MPTHYTTCLYIHGLHSSVHPEKKQILEKLFDNVVAFDMDYSTQTDAYLLLKQACIDKQIDFIIGSSFGGYLGYYLASELEIPCVLFNPALLFGKKDKIYVTAPVDKQVPFALFVVGERDTIVPPASIDVFLKEHPEESGIRVMKCSWLEHRVDLSTFETGIISGITLSGG